MSKASAQGTQRKLQTGTGKAGGGRRRLASGERRTGGGFSGDPLLRLIPDLITRISVDGLILDMLSPPGFQLLRARGDTVGRNLFEIMPPAFVQLAREAINCAHETGRLQTFEYEIEIGGQRRHREARVVAGAPGEVVAIVRDFTDMRRAQDRLVSLSQAMETTTDCVVITDLHGVITDVNLASIELYAAADASELIGKSAFDVIAPQDRASAVEGMREVLERGAIKHREYLVLDGEGNEVPVELSVAVIRDPAGAPTGFVAVSRDVRARREAEARALEREEYFRRLLENASDIITVIDGAGTVLFQTPAITRILGYERDELTGKCAFDYIHPEDLPLVLERFMELLRNPPGPRSVEFRFLAKDGGWKFLEASGQVYISPAGRVEVIVNSRDVTDRRTDEETIRRLAYHDVLTGLPNRALFRDRLEQAVKQAARSGGRAGVMFLDLDNFKVVNDSVGHMEGDKLLRRIGKRLQQVVREGDTVARLGGDEFTILLPSLDSFDEATVVAERVLRELPRPRRASGRQFVITGSIGITVYPDDGRDVEELLRNADVAMYRAKELGRNQYQMFTASMNTAIARRVEVESSLRSAIERDEMRVYYQPQVLVGSGEICGVEALVRWEHPERGLLLPGEFIAVAEDTGLITALGEWVLRTAGAHMRAWRCDGLAPIRLAVNLSARQFQRQDLLQSIERVLAETGFEPSMLQVEITEGVAMREPEAAARTLRGLRELGIGIALDDFGTGYSSLGYLRRFPIDALKIDRSFVNEVATDTASTEIAQAIITIAHHLGLRVIAEGVETEQQLSFLEEANCDEFQGFLFSRPLPEGSIREILLRGARPVAGGYGLPAPGRAQGDSICSAPPRPQGRQ